MRRYPALACAVALGFGLVLAPRDARGAAPGATTQAVADPGNRFTLAVPADWEVATRPTGMPAVVAQAPVAEDGSRAQVNVVVEDLPRPISSGEYAQASARLIKAIFREFTLIQEGPATIGDQAAFYRYFTWHPNGGDELYQVQVYFTTGRTAFIITGTTRNDPAAVRRDIPRIAAVVNTFRLLRPAGVSG